MGLVPHRPHSVGKGNQLQKSRGVPRVSQQKVIFSGFQEICEFRLVRNISADEDAGLPRYRTDIVQVRQRFRRSTTKDTLQARIAPPSCSIFGHQGILDYKENMIAEWLD